MSPYLIIGIISGYFLLIFGVSKLTSRGADSATFFSGNRESPWYLVAFGMIGTSLSGVTFISVPGWVGSSSFSYFQIVLGYMVGYAVIALVLMPVYYRLKTISIYSYLQERFGLKAHKTGAAFFLISRTIGASFRLFLVATVLQLAIFDSFGFPFFLTVLITILLIWIYTNKGGIKTIVFTDTLQTLFMLLALGLSIIIIGNQLGTNFLGLVEMVSESDLSKTFFWEYKSDQFFIKQFLSGAFIAVVMTGLDQDMMQKNLSCRTLSDGQKNVFWFSIILLVVNLAFLFLGALLYLYADQFSIEIPSKADNLFPLLALNHFGTIGAILFLLGIIAAAYSSADSALTALTTSFCVDFLDVNKYSEEKTQSIKRKVHIGFSLLLFLCVIVFEAINDDSVIASLFTVAGYTYGPLLGLFGYGILTKFKATDKWIPMICVLSVILTKLLSDYDKQLLNGYEFGFELLIINGVITFLGLFLSRKAS
ncbi:MAG: sodium:solute symporter [Bacteroidota bacterium]